MSLRLWSGSSLLDPSACISLYLTGLDKPSVNVKTGAMLQTWILRDDMDPIAARKTGADAAICGGCPHRAGSCYVNIAWAPNQIYKRRYTGEPFRASLLPWVAANKPVRLGAYGDPAAVPFDVWSALLEHASAHTGYTHQWRTCDQRLKRFCMASVDSLDERDEAHDLGWRTFRVGTPDAAPQRGEVLCPASAKAGKKMTCAQCLHCDGFGTARNGDVFIPVHGSAMTISAYIRQFSKENAKGQGTFIPATSYGAAVGSGPEDTLEGGAPLSVAASTQARASTTALIAAANLPPDNDHGKAKNEEATQAVPA